MPARNDSVVTDWNKTQCESVLGFFKIVPCLNRDGVVESRDGAEQCPQRPSCPCHVVHTACSSQASPELLSASLASGDQTLPVTGCCWPTGSYDGKKTVKSWERGWNRGAGLEALLTVMLPQRVCDLTHLWQEGCHKLLLPFWTATLLVLENMWRRLLLLGCFLIFLLHYISKGKYFCQIKAKMHSADQGKANTGIYYTYVYIRIYIYIFLNLVQ